MGDANKAFCSGPLYEKYTRRIASVEYSTCCLNEAQFHNLVFMGTNPTVWDKNQELVDKLTPESEPRTLKVVVERILTEYPYALSPSKIFKHLSIDEPWFEGCFIVSARFDPRYVIIRRVEDYYLWTWKRKESLQMAHFTLRMEIIELWFMPFSFA